MAEEATAYVSVWSFYLIILGALVVVALFVLSPYLLGVGLLVLTITGALVAVLLISFTSEGKPKKKRNIYPSVN